MAAGEIYLYLEGAQQELVDGMDDDPVKMWTMLKQTYQPDSKDARFNAYLDLIGIRKEETETLMELGSRTKSAAAILKSLIPKSTSSSPFGIKELIDEITAVTMLMALPPQDEAFVTSIRIGTAATVDDITTEFASQDLIRQRKRDEETRLQESAARAAAAIANTSKRTKSSKPRPTCSHCKRQGHSSDRCWTLHPELNPKNKANLNLASNGPEEKSSLASLRSSTSSSTLPTDLNWNTDTGATSHMTPHRHWLRDYEPYRVPIRLANNEVVWSVGKGKVLFEPVQPGGQTLQPVLFSRVLYVPNLHTSLFAVLRVAIDHSFVVTIEKNRMEI